MTRTNREVYQVFGPSRVSGVLTDVIDMSWGKHGSLDMCFWSWFPETFSLGYKVCIPWQCLATWPEWMEVWYPISCWRSCESRGIELCARQWERKVSLVSPFIDWSGLFFGWCLFVGGFFFAVCCLVWLADQSVRSCYQSMTILA